MSTKLMQEPWRWKGFQSDAINNYIGTAGEPFLDIRATKPILRISDGITSGGHPVTGSNLFSGYIKPEIVSPINGATGIVGSPMVTSTPMVGIKEDGSTDVHVASTWNFYTDAAKTNLLYTSSRDDVNLISIDLEGNHVFPADTPVYVEVIQEGESGYEVVSDLVHFLVSIHYPENYIGEFFASNKQGGALFGSSIAVSDDGLTAIVGARGYDTVNGPDEGRVYIFERINGVWSQVRLFAGSSVDGACYGWKVAISGNGKWAAASHRNKNFYIIYRKTDSGSWLQDHIDYTGSGEKIAELSFSYDGRRLMRGSYQADNQQGMAEIIQNSAPDDQDGSWSRLLTLNNPDGSGNNDKFGYKVKLSADGTKAFVMAYASGGVGDGLIHVYSEEQNWSRTQKILPPDPSGGQFGLDFDISYDGSKLIAIDHIANTDSNGFCYFFETDLSGDLVLIDSIPSPDSAAGLNQNAALSGNGDLILISTSKENYLLTNHSGSWQPIAVYDEVFGGDGSSLTLSGDGKTALIGCSGRDKTYRNSGSFYAYAQ